MKFTKTLSRDEMRNVVAGSGGWCGSCCDEYGCGPCKWREEDCTSGGKMICGKNECAWVE